VIIAHPPNTMAFAVTDVELDSRTIPESYILMRDVKKLPYASYFMQPGETAEMIGKKTPMVIVKNDCVISTGNSLLNAFDRLEVAEYSAKAIISTKHLGSIININDQQIEEINKAFHLE
jgi:L-fuculose-phosphate aldolase